MLTVIDSQEYYDIIEILEGHIDTAIPLANVAHSTEVWLIKK